MVTRSDSLTLTPAHRAFRVLPFALLTALSLTVLFLYSSWNRPIWYDEFVYFSLGGLNDLQEALAAIRDTTSNLNQGVTGAFMLSDFLLLKLFGAELWAMRLPSLLTGAWMVMAGAVFLRFRGVGLWGLSVWPVLLMGQVTLMYYVGEARTYMPLAGAVVGALAYWSITIGRRNRWWVRALGWGSVLMGVVFHPYFAVYLPLIVIFGWSAFRLPVMRSEGLSATWRSFLKFCNPVLIVVAATTYVALAFSTWLQGTATKVNLDPYVFLTDPLWKSILAQLFQFAYVSRWATVITLLGIGVLVVYAGSSVGLRRVVARTWPPAALLVIAFASALLISLVSLSQGFWIIPRQWIASIALASVSVIWLVVELVRMVSSSRVRLMTSTVFTGVILGCAVAPTQSAVDTMREFSARVPAPPSQLENLILLRSQGLFPTEQVWIDAAQSNIDAGGPVHPVFGDFYTDRDWQNFRLTD